MVKKTNGFDAKVNALVGRIETLQRTIEIERAACAERCNATRDDIKEIYVEAKEAGIPPKELKQAIKARDLNRKIEALRDKSKDKDTYDQIRFALGDLADTPLGEAATKAA